MNPLTPFLEGDGVVILDGALATELERRGADLRDPLWSAKILLENPDLIRQVHCDYFAAGANVATTASYQATIPGLMNRGLSRVQAADVLRLSLTLARQARDEFENCAIKPLVAASIGSYGASLHNGAEYHGNYGMSVQQLIDWHRPRVEILANAGADLLALETVPSLDEAEALISLLRDFPNTQAWLSLSCQDERRICHGEQFADAVALANESPSIAAVGVNCTSPRFIEGLLDSVASIAKKPLVVYPNSGETWDGQQHCWRGSTTTQDWKGAVRRWRDAGARLIGGCCRTTPETIRQIAYAMRNS
jgi:homocysteine S-methyltransferase